MSHRKQQLEGMIRESVQAVINRGMQDPRIRGLITITGIRLTGDLKRADMLVSVMPEDKAELTLHGLRSAANFIRQQIAKEIPGRVLPHLTFEPDRGAMNESAVNRALAEVNREREARGELPLTRAESDAANTAEAAKPRLVGWGPAAELPRPSPDPSSSPPTPNPDPSDLGTTIPARKTDGGTTP